MFFLQNKKRDSIQPIRFCFVLGGRGLLLMIVVRSVVSKADAGLSR